MNRENEVSDENSTQATRVAIEDQLKVITEPVGEFQLNFKKIKV